MYGSAKKEREFVLKDLERELEFYKKKELLAVVFFDGEDRTKINYYRNKKKEVEKMIKAIKEYEVD